MRRLPFPMFLHFPCAACSTWVALGIGALVLLGAGPRARAEGAWDQTRAAATAGVDQVRAAAVAGLDEFLALVPEGDEKDYGFAGREEFAGAKVGEPYRMLTLSPAAIAESRGVDGMETVDEWRVPVLVHGKARALLTVARVDGTWKVVSLGAAGLARHLAVAVATSGTKNQAGARFVLRIYQLRSDFLLTVGAQGIRLWALPSAQMMLSLDGARDYDLSALLPVLANAVAEAGGAQ